ncbi:MAG: hypothetical protein WDW38_003145 [Sanguina aurantia]
MDCDGEGAESGEQQQSDEDDEEDDGACSVDLRAENSRLHRDLEAMTKERDLLRHFGPIVTQLQEENATITANVHAISQQLARLLDAQKAPAGAAQSSLPAPLPRPSSRPQASAQPTAGADPGLLPPPPHRYLRTAAADPPRPPATRGLYIVLPLTCIPGATPELVEAAMTTTFQVPVTVRAIFPRKPQAERRSGDAGDSTPAHVAALAALGLVVSSQPEAEPVRSTAAQAEDTLQRFVVTYAVESIGAVRGRYKKLRAMGIVFHDDLTPQQQRNKAAQKATADRLYTAGTPISLLLLP